MISIIELQHDKDLNPWPSIVQMIAQAGPIVYEQIHQKSIVWTFRRLKLIFSSPEPLGS